MNDFEKGYQAGLKENYGAAVGFYEAKIKNMEKEIEELKKYKLLAQALKAIVEGFCEKHKVD